MRTWNHAFVSTSPSGSRLAQLNTVPPGRRIVNVPTKPPATSAQRNVDTSSFSVVAASKVTTSGAMSTIEVNSASGM